jgi:hypothetical protein
MADVGAHIHFHSGFFLIVLHKVAFFCRIKPLIKLEYFKQCLISPAHNPYKTAIYAETLPLSLPAFEPGGLPA